MLHTIDLHSGAALTLRTFEPAAAPLAAVVVPSAMGVTQNFYGRFAQWLAARGYLAATFDYRGIGQSAPATLRGFQVDIRDWATQDCPAVIEFMKARAPGVPLYWIGHSLGGQLLGLIPNRERIDRIVTVAAGNGYWRENSWQTKRFVWWLWFVAAPLALRIAGYFPGKRLRKVGDLPRGVMEQWRRWCLNREYVVGVEGEGARRSYASVRMPMLSLSFTDDEMMSEQGIRSLHGLYANAPIEYRRIAPRDVGVQRIGHFGFFRPQFEQTLWPLLPQWLAAH
ncbi:MAG TPA: alpha/beta fold hydrolase [Steroidobacteraceae bacterium]|jgi:predicted alpha/beta hydrolase|nr:alpha/beta fold hydrolase [Steroidobacteraceae bacterium]